MDSNFGGGLYDLSVVRIDSFQFPSVNSDIMLSAKESRRARRQAASMLEHETHRATGMDLLPFSAASWRQDDMWKCLERSTITIAHGSAGTGKTLVALWYGLKGVSEGKYEKVYYQVNVYVDGKRINFGFVDDANDSMAIYEAVSRVIEWDETPDEVLAKMHSRFD